MMNIFFFLFILKKIIYLNGYIVLPISTLQKENYISPYSPNSPQGIIYFEHCNSFITEIDIGNPRQKIPFLVEMKTNDFVVTSVNPMNKNYSEYDLKKTEYNFSPNFFKEYKFYNENKSPFFSSKICEDRKRKYHKYEDYEFPIAEETCSSYDSFYLYKDIKMKNVEENKNFYFDLVRNIRDNVTGIIGLSLSDDSRKANSFISILKRNNLTENYYWFFDFDSPKNEKGKLVIGATLDQIYGNKYDNKVLDHIKGGYGNLYWEIKFDRIFINNSSEKKYFDNSIELNYDSNVICAPFEYKNYFSSLVNDLYINNICENSTFNGSKHFYDNKGGEWTFVYCKNNQEVKSKLKELILPIHFFTSDLNYTFEITSDDILKETEEYIFIKILFQKYGGVWNLGKPFTLKYKFMFNPDKKEIGFYTREKEKTSNLNKTFILVLIIIGLCIIFITVGVILGKKIYGLKKKKRANELDDDYEYYSEEQKKKDEKIQNSLN